VARRDADAERDTWEPRELLSPAAAQPSIRASGGANFYAGQPLHRNNGAERWALTLWPLPEGMSYEDVCAIAVATTKFLQAAGRADALMVEIRKPGGAQFGCQWVRYFVGHPHETPKPLDVPIELPHGAVMVSADEVFGAEEAADLFLAYQQTKHLPLGYALRPVEGYRADGSIVIIGDDVVTLN
jgi:hypothetical protein